jgi:hypothetical protein
MPEEIKSRIYDFVVDRAAAESKKAVSDLAVKIGVGKIMNKVAISGLVPIVGFFEALGVFLLWWMIKILGMKIKGIAIDVGIMTSILVWTAFLVQMITLFIAIAILVIIIKVLTLGLA